MALSLGQAALVTGAGSGIGRAVSVALAARGLTVTVAELSVADGQETVRLIEAEHAKLPERPKSPSAIFIQCDVQIPEQLFDAFALHERTYGRLDVLVNNAGIGEFDFFTDDISRDGKNSNWRKTMNVNLSATIDGTRLGIQLMRRTKIPGVIVNMASASGLYPAWGMPIYSSSKGGVVLFTRSLRILKKEGIHVNACCPEFVSTKLTAQLAPSNILDGYLPMDEIVKGIFQLMEDKTRAGDCLWITKRRGFEYWPTKEEMAKYELPIALRPGYKTKIKYSDPPAIPKEYRKVIIHKLTHDFRAASKIVTVHLKMPVKPGYVLIKYLYAGVNASDVNFSSGRYHGPGEAEKLLPLNAGFEAVGIVAGVGEGVDSTSFKLGSPVATLTYGGFAEFKEVNHKQVIQVPVAVPEIVALLTSGLTASISLQEAGRMKSGETVLVTAAAGGTGQFAVQLAKLAGNKVVATCGGQEKAGFLKSLGADRVIDYQKENLKSVLKKEFPNGIDLIYESVGGEMFKTCLNALAKFGRIIVIGMISQYQGENGWEPSTHPGLLEKLLNKSQTVAGFFLVDYTRLWREHTNRLAKLYLDGKLKVSLDPKPFVGLESVADAVEYLHSGRSVGKVIVQIDAASSRQSRL
ncbi:unnamed protein product [Calypogeia fissa]